MKVNIEITEGCMSFSYLINGIEWVELDDKESKNYNIELLNKVTEALIKEVVEQYNIPSFMEDYLWDGIETNCEQDTFIRLVKNDKNTTVENLGHCDDCGDDIERYKLEIEI